MEILDLYNLRIKQIIDRFAFYMLKNPNIVGVGRGNKVINGHTTNKPALVFFVEKKLSMNSLNKAERIPRNIQGVLTDVIESGPITSQSGFYNFSPQTAPDKPALGGGGLMYQNPENPTKLPLGTLTYAFTFKENKSNIYFLTSRHFSVDIKEKSKVPIRYVTNPSNFKTSWELGKIVLESEAYYSENLKATVLLSDAALGLVGPNNDITKKNKLAPGLINGKLVTGTQTAKIGDKIYKCGIRSGLTTGVVTTLDFTRKVTMPDKSLRLYPNQIVTKQDTTNGDSGALGVIENTGKAFGMLNAGTNDLTIYNNIQTVMDSFNIEFLT